MGAGRLIQSVTELQQVLDPLTRNGAAPAEAAIDTETTEVFDERFTPYGTTTRLAGFSVSYEDVDFYAPVRHVPYDWRVEPGPLRAKHPELFRDLVEIERVSPGGGWADGADPNLPLEPTLRLLQEAFSNPRIRWVGHNWGFDGPILSVEGLRIPWRRIDETQFLSQLTDTRPLDAWDNEKQKWAVSHRLKELGEDILGIPPSREERLKEVRKALGKSGAQLMNYAMLPLRTVVAPYACMDTRLTLDLFLAFLQRETAKDPRVWERYERELRLIPHLAAIEERGIAIRVDLAEQLRAQAEQDLEEIAIQATAAAGRELHFGHSETLAQQLYGELKAPMYRGKTDTQKTTLKMVLKKLEDEPVPGERDVAAVVRSVLEYRGKEKELTSFFRPLSNYGADGTIHPILRQMAAATTRMSAAKPNLQQMKKKGEVRRVFKPRDGHVFVFFDYDQIEMRIAAHYTGVVPPSFRSVFTWPCTMAKRGSCKGKPPHGPADNPAECRRTVHSGWRADWNYRPEELHLLKGFLEDPEFDPHQRMADIAGVPRDDAKASNFALLYGAGYVKLSEVLDCSMTRAKELFHFFWDEAYPELSYVKAFIDERLRRVGQMTKFSGQEYITTLKGGRIYLDSAYKGLNYLVQRSAREVFGDGFCDVSEYCKDLEGYWPLMPVHDEAILEVAKCDYDPDVLRRIAEMMRAQGGACSVPLTVGCEVSDTSWHKDERDEVKL